MPARYSSRRRGHVGCKALRGQEARVLALLAAYGKAVVPAVLGNIERAVKSWRDGDHCLAHIHLAHSGLRAPSELGTAACRLFIAECAIKAGMSPRAIFKALEIGSSYVDAVEKAYNPDEPRVPAGNGRTSGEWTDGGVSSISPVEAMAASATATLDALLPATAESLGEFAAGLLARFGGPAAAAFGLLFIPSSDNLNVTGAVPGVPKLFLEPGRNTFALELCRCRRRNE